MTNQADSLEDILLAQESKPVTTGLVDGDIVAYRAAAAVDGSYYCIKGNEGRWKYIVDVKDYCDKHGIDKALIEHSYEPEPVAHALAIVKQTMRILNATLEARHDNCQLITYLTGKENFRYDINPQYKDNRKGKHKPKHLAACKEYLEKHYGAEYKAGYEADDLLTIKATEMSLGDKSWVICSIDKDLKQMPGDHYNWVNDEYVTVTPGEARKNLWSQVITGDGTDNIYSPKGLGKAKVAGIFADVRWENVVGQSTVKVATTDEELFKLCASAYALYLTKPKKSPCKDTADVMCWVHETYNQVYLLRELI